MTSDKRTIVEIQYFHGCPHADEMIKRVREAIEISEVDIEYKEILVDTPEKAELHKFRGSPTVLVNGGDLEGLPTPESGSGLSVLQKWYSYPSIYN